MTPATFTSFCDSLQVDGNALSDMELAIAFGLADGRSIRHCKAGNREVSGPAQEVMAHIQLHGLLPETVTAIRERRARDGRRKP
jgi:hypothetical protein